MEDLRNGENLLKKKKGVWDIWLASIQMFLNRYLKPSLSIYMQICQPKMHTSTTEQLGEDMSKREPKSWNAVWLAEISEELSTQQIPLRLPTLSFQCDCIIKSPIWGAEKKQDWTQFEWENWFSSATVWRHLSLCLSITPFAYHACDCPAKAGSVIQIIQMLLACWQAAEGRDTLCLSFWVGDNN